MNFIETSLKGCFVITPKILKDTRGWFARVYCENEFKAIDNKKHFVQLNHSFNLKKGTLRGMHYQRSPYSETKLVRCIRGSIYDVVIDLRKNSETYLNWFSVELSAKNSQMIYIPDGFAHGFQTLENDTELLYHHSEFYTPEYETGIHYSDPRIAIQWPLTISSISERDSNFPFINSLFKGL